MSFPKYCVFPTFQHFGILFVFEGVDSGALALLDVATKAQLPFDEYVVVAGRVQSSRQLTCLGGRVKRDGKRRLLVVAVPQQPPEADAAQTPSVQVLDVGEMAVRFLHDVRGCFPTLVRKSPMTDEDASDSEDEEEHKKRLKRDDGKPEDSGETKVDMLKAEAAAYMSQTRAKVLPSLEQLFTAFEIADPVNVQAALRRDPSLSKPCQFLCLDCPALGSPDEKRGATPRVFGCASAPPEPLNFGVMFSEVAVSKGKEQYLHIPVPRSPPLPLPKEVHDDDYVQESFMDATVLSFGAKREATAHGGGKSCEEMIKNIRMRHASGTFCTLVLPEKTWEQVADAHKSFLPQVNELHGELRLRRLMGSAPCVPVELHLEH